MRGEEGAGVERDFFHFRPHGVSSSFKSGSVKDDLFIREDVMIKYNISSTTNNDNYLQPGREEEL